MTAGRVLVILGLAIDLWAGTALAAAETRATVGQSRFRVALAQTPKDRQRGLMFQAHLPRDEGMLFIQAPGPASFWMKNTLIPLDLLFFDADGTLLEIIPGAQPCRQPDCPIYPSRSTAVRYILEINAGEAERRRIRPGDRLGLDPRAGP